jgi:myo-inositol-1(or 4)-monophosphatase
MTGEESTPVIAPDALRRHAEHVARAAGRFAQEHVHRKGEVDARLPHDIKLRMDRDTQQVAEAAVLEAYPGHAILGEEGNRGHSNAEYRWVIDPIDGTMNYFVGIPYWCTSVAVQRKGKTVAGAVYHPALDECFSADATSPAWCNGVVIRPSDVSRLEESLIATAGLPRVVEEGANRVSLFVDLMRQAGKLRILGAAALDICYVACGRLDAMYEVGLKVWDVAAAGLIADRAGAHIERYDVERDGSASYLVAGANLWKPLAALARRSHSSRH